MFSKRNTIKRSPHVCPLMFKMAYAVDGDRAQKEKKKNNGVFVVLAKVARDLGLRVAHTPTEASVFAPQNECAPESGSTTCRRSVSARSSLF